MASAIGTYATPANVKARIGKTDSTDDTILGRICDQVNAWIEEMTERVLAPVSSATLLFDGDDTLENGRCLVYPRGFRAVTLLEVAFYTGGAFNTIPATDYFLNPNDQERQPNWPYTELWMTDIPSSGNPCPRFMSGMSNIRVTATTGWPVIPDEIVEIAELQAVRAYTARKTGQSDIAGVDDTGQALVRNAVDAKSLHVLRKYTIKMPEII